MTQQPRLTSPAALRALAHPTRLHILGHLQLHGDSTATECAAEVGESASSCSYHLRTLAKHGFVEEVPTGDGRERRWHAGIAGYEFPAGAEEDDDYRTASALARAALLEVSDDNVREYLARESSFSPAWPEAATFIQTTIVATPAELELIAKAFQELLAPYAPSARGGTPRGGRFVSLSLRAVPRP